MITSQNWRVSWKQTNPRDCVWKELHQEFMKTILQEKGIIHCITTIWYTNLFLCRKQWKYLKQKLQWTKSEKTLRKFRRGIWRESQINLQWSRKQETRTFKYILLHWWICHLTNAELEKKHQKYEGRVVLRGDTVKDDSGSYVAFTEQGSSASQVTAAKVMGIISRLPGCARQAADAVPAYTQVKMEDAPKLLKNPKSKWPDTWIRVPRH